MNTPTSVSGRNSTTVWSLFAAALLAVVTTPAPAANCSLTYNLPADFPPSVIIPNQATDADFMVFSWQHFLALNAPGVGDQISFIGDNSTQWSHWSSTGDLYNSADPGPSGSRYYPAACRDIPNFEQYRVLQQVGKVDDSFLEAQTGGLSDDPVVDAAGNFLRYEILYSPALYDEVKDQGLNEQSVLLNLNDNLNLSCGVESYTGGNPANPNMGALVLKIAWRDASGLSDEEHAKYHTEDLLVFTPSYRNSTGSNICELKPMAMVGMHIGHKTTKQPTWVWATFEHALNAPDCTSQSPAPTGGGGSAGVNTTCPEAPLGESYSFFPSTCDDDDSCAACNTAPAPNGAAGQCDSPLDSDEDSWCLDLPPNPVGGMSRLCRQVPSHVCSDDVSIGCTSDDDCSAGAGTCEESYPAAPEQNEACWDAITNAGNGNSVWLNYELISTQWVAENFTQCDNQAASVVTPPADTQSAPGPVKNEDLRELVVLDPDSSLERPLLGNTSMESYDRSNCLGCHAKSYMGNFCENDTSLQCSEDSDCTSVGGNCTLYSYNMDFLYSLTLEVGQPPGLRLPGTRLLYRDSPSWRWWSAWRRTAPSVAWSMESPGILLGLTGSVDDPRLCSSDPSEPTRTFVRFVRDGTELVEQKIELPCQGWHLKGDPANPSGYEYRDLRGAWGPCRMVTIEAGKKVTAQCSGPGVPSNLADTDATINVVLKTGTLRYCAQYTSFQMFGRSLVISKGNSAPDLCSVW